MKKSLSVVILAAGNSSRMNFPKAFLPFDEEWNFIEKIIETYIAAGIEDIIVVINETMERRLKLILSIKFKAYNIELVINRFPERGRSYSIQQGLKNVNNNFCFIQNIDNPFLTTEMLKEMIKLVSKTNYVVPACGNKDGHPVLIGSDIKEHLLLLKGDDHNLRTELKNFSKINLVWPFEDILANINTREDYRKYFLSLEAVV